MSPQASILYHTEGVYAFVTLNRPEVLNAIDSTMRQEIAASVIKADTDANVRAIILRGSGARAFSAGADIQEFESVGSLIEARKVRVLAKWTDVIAGVSKPTLAVVHGYCLGGGLEIALACDVRIASDDASFGFPEVGLGIIPGAGGTQRLSRVVGQGHALELIMSGRRFGADHAFRIGLISEVLKRSDLEPATRRWADMLTQGPPQAVSYAKEAIRRGSELPLAEGLRIEAELSTLLLSTADRLEGKAAFRERRLPRYQGD